MTIRQSLYKSREAVGVAVSRGAEDLLSDCLFSEFPILAILPV